MKQPPSTAALREGLGWGLVEGAREVAETSDRMFLSMTRLFGRLGGWAGKEVDVVVDSAKAAATTTAEVSKRFLPFGSFESPPSTATANAQWGDGGETDETSEDDSSFGLLSATPARQGGAPRGRTLTEPNDAGDDVEHPPGVLPMLHGLGRLMAEHRQAGYRTLARDQHFWALLGLLHGSLSIQSSQERKGDAS